MQIGILSALAVLTTGGGVLMRDDYAVNVKALPFTIDTVSAPSLSGQIGISHCPGMKLFSTLDLYDDRIENDLQSIRNWGAAAIVTLLELRELAMLGVADLPDRVHSMNMHWLHLPIKSMDLPDETFENGWKLAGPQLLQLLSDGQRILIHCKEGVGRSGVVAARILIESGVDPATALRTVRKARPGCLTLTSHENYCYDLVHAATPAADTVSSCYAMPRPVSA